MADYPVSFKYTDFNDKSDPLVDGFEEGSDSPPTLPVGAWASATEAAEEAVEELLKWGVETFTLKCGSKTSTSFDDQDHTPIAAGKTAPERFYFAPTEDSVDVAWTLKNPEEMADTDEVTLELYAFGGSAPVWQRTLKPTDAKKQKLGAAWDGSFPEGEWIDTASFPAHLVTAEYSPYMMKIRATGKIEKGLEERWTYFDVLVHGIELEWGPDAEKVLPIAVPDPDDGRRARHLYANTALRDTTDTDNLSGLIPKDGENKLVPLKSNLFYQGESELRGANNEFYTKYKTMWGDGAMLPIMVNAKICSATDAPVDVPAALGNVKYLWDWEDKATNDTPGIKAEIKTHLDKVSGYFTAESNDSPAGSNCHVNRGGKRGFGAAPVFPPQGGIDPVDTLPDPGDDAADFPFNVTQCADRKWAGISKSWTTGELAGKSGVIFQPSRMAGDAYALRVSLFFREDTKAVQAAASDTETYPDELSAATGTFTVWQEVDIAQYVQIGTVATPVDMDTVKTDMAKFFVKLNYDDSLRVDGTAQWQTGMQKVYDAAGTLRGQLADYIQDALPNAAAGDTLIEFKSFTDFKEAWVTRGGSEGAAYNQSAATANPTNAIGEPKYDWLSRPQSGVQNYPFQQPWPIDHTNEVTVDTQGSVRVEFEDPKGGTHEHTVVFEASKRIIKSKNIDLAITDLKALAACYDNCLRNT
ncbi:MAG: hypothetical protein L3K26_19470, partial [Candidatus Hydrogenedentes bacterium]|nr:hypothetical protein [Candidatus Hydrogenedentota bacterium]